MAKVEDTQENFNICMDGNCATCPSFTGQPGEGLFCARGASKSSVKKRGCNCPECRVWMANGLSSMYYCVKPKR
ncbi:MAG: DUF2769 domain-containing protein [Sedimentisphaerales bacterium]